MNLHNFFVVFMRKRLPYLLNAFRSFIQPIFKVKVS